MELTPVRLDYAAAVALAVVLAGSHEVAQTTNLTPPVALILVLLSALPAAVRRRCPLPVLTVITAAATVLLALSVDDPVPQLAVGFVIYLIPSRFSRWEACWLLAGTPRRAICSTRSVSSRPGTRCCRPASPGG